MNEKGTPDKLTKVHTEEARNVVWTKIPKDDTTVLSCNKAIRIKAEHIMTMVARETLEALC